MCFRRYIGCYEKDSDRFVKDIPLRPIALSFLQHLFRTELESEHDPLVGYVYDIGATHAAALASYATEPLDLDKFDYFLESGESPGRRPSKKNLMAGGPGNLLAIFDDDGEKGTLALYNEDGTPQQGVIAETQVYRCADFPSLRNSDIELGWSDDMAACFVRIEDIYRELRVPDMRGPSLSSQEQAD